MFQNPEQVLLIASVILFLSIFAGKAGYRFGLPALLLFLGVGMLFGSDGLGIQFSDPNVAQFIGMLALSIILFSGGMDTKVAEVKPIASQGVVLATLGVLATTFITGGFIYWLFGLFGKYVTLTFPESLLLAAVITTTLQLQGRTQTLFQINPFTAQDGENRVFVSDPFIGYGFLYLRRYDLM